MQSIEKNEPIEDISLREFSKPIEFFGNLVVSEKKLDDLKAQDKDCSEKIIE